MSEQVMSFDELVELVRVNTNLSEQGAQAFVAKCAFRLMPSESVASVVRVIKGVIK